MDSLVLAAIVLLVILLAAGGYVYWRKHHDSGPEVYYYGVPSPNTKSAYSFTLAEAEAQAQKLGGTLATMTQVAAAQAAGAQWCGWGWTQAGDGASYLTYPRQGAYGCDGRPGLNIMAAPGTTAASVAVYGVKPPPPAGNCNGSAPCIAPWYDGDTSPATPARWSRYSQ
jgi:Extracellular link domain